MSEKEHLVQNDQRPQKQGRLSRLFKIFDRNPYTVSLFYDKKREYGSKTGGSISFIFYVASIAIFAFNITSFIKEEKMNYSQTDIKNDFYNQVKLDNDSFSLNITGCINGSYFLINSSNLLDYGLQVMAEWTSMINGSASQVQKAQTNPLGLFKFPQTWNDILTLKGRSDVSIKQQEQYKRLGMFIKITNITAFNLLKNMTVKVILNMSVTHPNDIQFQQAQKQKTRIFYIRDGFPIKKDQLQELNLYFRMYYVLTDNSFIFPDWLGIFNSISSTNYTHFHQQFTTMATSNDNLFEADENKIVWIKLKRSIFSTKFQRQFNKLPYFLSASFSWIAVLLFLILPCRGYSQWEFLERKIQKVDQNKQKINLLTYFLSLIHKKKDTIQQMRSNSTATQQFYDQLDIKKLIQRITDLQNRLRDAQLQNKSRDAQIARIVQQDKKNKRQKVKSNFSQNLEKNQ